MLSAKPLNDNKLKMFADMKHIECIPTLKKRLSMDLSLFHNNLLLTIGI